MSKTAVKKRTRWRTAPDAPHKTASKGSVTAEYIKAIALAFALALFIRTFVVQAYRIPSGSMEDTLLVGDFLLANKFIYGVQVPFIESRLPALREPALGDVVIFQYPGDPNRDFVKRIVALPGQTVEVRDKVLYVNGKRTIDPPKSKYVDPHILKKNSPGGMRDNFGPEAVPEGHFFVMGDNRDNSEDSRYWGYLPRQMVRGQALMLYWSWAPDANAPAYRSLASIPGMALYNLIHLPNRTRWGRIGTWVR